MSSDLGEDVAEYYLQINSLSKIQAASKTPEPEVIEEPPKGNPGISFQIGFIIFALVIVVLAFLPIVIGRRYKAKHFFINLAVAFLVVLIPFSINLARTPTDLESQALAEPTPKNVKVTQVANDSFLVIWQTEVAEVGAVRLGMEPDSSQMSRVFSQEIVDKPTSYHFIKVDKLDPDKDYYFEILSGGSWYNNLGEPVKVHTLATKQ